jgi:PAS domain-containing protein
MLSYEYTPINKCFLDRLEDTVMMGNSVLLIGPRFGGKRTVLEDLGRRLGSYAKHQSLCKIVLSDGRPPSDKELCGMLVNSLPPFLRPLMPSFSDQIDKFFDRLTKALQPGTKLMLLIDKVDSLPLSVAQRFLRCLETQVEGGRIIAVLTGEVDVREMLGGVRNEFGIAQRYVLQWYDCGEFENRILTYLDPAQVVFENTQKSLSLLFEQTGGSLYLAQLAIKRLRHKMEANRKNEMEYASPLHIDYSVLKDELALIARTLTWHDPLVMNAVVHITQSPSCSAALDALLNRDILSLTAEEAALGPTLLELAGVAVRKPKADSQAQLAFSSPLMKSFMEFHFDQIRLGDLYANSGDWAKAIEQYKAAPPEERIRPRNTWDRLRADNMVRLVCADLHMKASGERPVENVDTTFANGCQYLLGFTDVSFISWYLGGGKGTWRVGRSTLKPAIQSMIVSTLPPAYKLEEGPFDLAVPGSFATAICVGSNPGEKVIVVVGDWMNRTTISPGRQELLDELVNHYLKARAHARQTEVEKQRLHVLRQYHSINRFIGHKMQQEERLDITEVLNFASDQIMELGYSVFGVGLYSTQEKEKKVVCGIYNVRKNNDIKRSQKWPTRQLEREQLLTAEHGEPRQVEGHGRKIWILPVRSLAGEPDFLNADASPAEVTHTLTVQRDDGASLSPEEREDLINFGDQLLEAFQKSERMILLQSSMNHLVEPVLIVDINSRVRYVNDATGKLFNLGEVKPGWQNAEQAPHIKKFLHGKGAERIVELLRSALEDLAMTEVADDGLGNNPLYYGRMSAGGIHNSRKGIIGSYLHIQEFSELFSLFEAVQHLFRASTTKAIIDLLMDIARPETAWRRFYWLKDDGHLIGEVAVGPFDPELKSFNEKKLEVPRIPRHESAWWCFDRNAPVLLQYTSTKGKRSKYGVPIEAVPRPPWKGILKRKPGDMWVDVPLCGRKAIGKICMYSDDEIRPEQIEFWRILGSVAGLALDNLQRESEGRQNAALAAERVFLTSMAHNLHTKISSLGTVKYRFDRALEKVHNPELAAVNNQFGRFLASVQDVLDRVKHHVGILELKPQTFDLATSMKLLIAEQGLDSQSELIGPTDFPIFADRTMVESMVSELIQNSKDFFSLPKLKLRICWEKFNAVGRQWIRITYLDNGPGVPQEMKERIFDLFFTHRTNGTVGTGLGLYFAQRVALAHGGQIIENGDRSGARFVVELPQDMKEVKDANIDRRR